MEILSQNVIIETTCPVFQENLGSVKKGVRRYLLRSFRKADNIAKNS